MAAKYARNVVHLTTEEFAERLHIKPATVRYKRTAEGWGPPYIKVGNDARYRLADVEDWEKAQLIQPGAA